MSTYIFRHSSQQPMGSVTGDTVRDRKSQKHVYQHWSFIWEHNLTVSATEAGGTRDVAVSSNFWGWTEWVTNNYKKLKSHNEEQRNISLTSQYSTKKSRRKARSRTKNNIKIEKKEPRPPQGCSKQNKNSQYGCQRLQQTLVCQVIQFFVET